MTDAPLPGHVATIVIGAGTGGAACAGMLAGHSEEPILVLDAGPDYGPFDPAAWPPDMLDAKWGRIVNISSSSTHSGAPFMSHYVAAKSAVNGLTKSLALEYGPNGITVNAVPPGFIDTPMLRSAEERGNLGDIEKTIAATPVRRMGKPEDIAAACAFLVSEEAGYITGQILGVNGGRNT